MSQPLYKPTGSVFLSELEDSQCRTGLQAPPFEGKTTAALTWPNPVIVSYDRKVTAHLHRGDVAIVPFYDGDFVDSIVRRNGINCKPNRKDSFIRWMYDEGTKLSHEQTLILDGIGGIESSFHLWFEENKDELAYSKKGEFNKFVEWDLKKKYFEEVFDCIKAVKCDVIGICWETADRDEKGELNGKYRPLITGQTGDKLGGNFTDWMAVKAIKKPSNKDQANAVMEWAGIDSTILEQWIASTPKGYQTIHLFQTQADDVRSCGCTSLNAAPKYIIANYETFSSYRNKPISPATTKVA